MKLLRRRPAPKPHARCIVLDRAMPTDLDTAYPRLFPAGLTPSRRRECDAYPTRSRRTRIEVAHVETQNSE